MSTTIPTAQAAYEAAIRADERERLLAAIVGGIQRINGKADAELAMSTTQQPAPATGKAAKGWKLKMPVHGLDEKPIARKRKGKRADLSVLRDAMIAHVKKHPGQGAQEIRKAIGAKQSQMPTLRVLTSHAVKTKGVRRSMTYWPRGK